MSCQTGGCKTHKRKLQQSSRAPWTMFEQLRPFSRATEVEESLAKTLQGFHGSRPDPSMFENLEVMAYGSPTTLASVAQVVLKSPKSATITVFDPSVTPAVRDALLSAKMDLNPEVDGSNINLYIPKQTRETREEMAKVVGRHVEHAKHALRKLRKAAMDDVAKAEAEDFPEDDAQREKDIVDVLIKKATERLDKQHDAKKRELLESPSAS
eukprot:scaffold2325_cov257-Pinguiococcus_pyrenoidosus.AAC.14